MLRSHRQGSYGTEASSIGSLDIKSVGRCRYEPAVHFLKRWPEDQITIFDGELPRVVRTSVIFQCRFRKGERLFYAGLILGQPAFDRVPSVLVRRVDLTGQVVRLDGWYPTMPCLRTDAWGTVVLHSVGAQEEANSWGSATARLRQARRLKPMTERQITRRYHWYCWCRLRHESRVRGVS
jgi:hypothetical protein